MEKVKLPKEVAEAIETMKFNDMTNFAIVCSMKSKDWAKKNGCKVESVVDANEVLYKYSFGDVSNNADKAMVALVNGYEIDYTPEEQVKHYWDVLMAKRYEVEDGNELEKLEAEIHGIENTLNLLGIGIDILNDC